MFSSVLVLFLFMFIISLSAGTLVAHLTWSPPIGDK